MPKKSRVCRLGTAYVEWIHDKLVSAVWPTKDPIAVGEYRSHQLLESALGRSFQWAGGQDAYPEIVEKAAALFHSLIANHPFHNGNKRTAVLAMDAFLIGNGYSLVVDNDLMYELAQDTASYRERGIGHDQQLQHITDVLDENTVEIEILRNVRISDKKMRDTIVRFCKEQTKARRSIRRHPLNKLL